MPLFAMTTDERIALRLWREAGRHDELQPALSAALAAAKPELEAGSALIRHLIPEHRLWETVALAGAAARKSLVRTDRVPPDAELELPRELRRERMLLIESASFARRHPGILPDFASGPALVAVLSDAPRVTGVLVLAGLHSANLSRAGKAVALAMLEPLASALRHYVRERDAVALREAAEADRRSLLTRLGRNEIADSIVGADAGLREVMERVAQVARSDAPVLLLGETGSGKEVVARAIHRGSDRASGPFVRVNCGAISAELIDSELFGHERGSFTGAVARRKGWFERADTGTLFLDEVAELPLPAQVRLLRVLQDGLVQRVGGEHSITVDVRVVAATHQDLPAMMRERRFRDDLWYRLAVFPIRLPSLRERTGDLPALAVHFAQRAASRLGLAPCLPSDEDMRLLCDYDWPGNIRELSSVIERAAILGNGRRLEVRKALGIGAPSRPTQAAIRPVDETDLPASRGEFVTLEQHARAHIEGALRNCLGRVDGPFGAARLLGVNPQTLRSRMKKLGIDFPAFRVSGTRS